jgi:hypothetical protein
VQLQVIARRYRDNNRQVLDDWFIRISPPRALEIAQPFLTWSAPATRLTKIPLVPLAAHFGAVVNTAASGFPQFDTPPRLSFRLEKFDEGTGNWASLENRMLESAARSREIVFETGSVLNATGRYRYRYELEGTTHQGPAVTRSSLRYVEVRFGWEYVAAFAALMLALATVLLSRGARLAGSVTLEEPEDDYAADSLRSVKEYRSESLDAQSGGALGNGHAFRLTPRRFLMWKSVRLEMVHGQATLDPGGGTVGAGASVKWKIGLERKLKFDRAGDGARVVVSIRASLG